MQEHLSTQYLEGYCQRTLGPDDLLTLDDHLAVCAECRWRLREMKSSPAAFLKMMASLEEAAVTEDDHPSREQLTTYLADRLEAVDRELVESHLDFCPQCVEQIEAWRAEPLTTEPSAIAADATDPPVASERAVGPVEPSAWWKRWRLWPEWGSFPLALRVAFAVALIAASVWGIARWLRATTKKQEIVQQPTASPSAFPQISPPGSDQQPDRALLALNDGDGQIAWNDREIVSGAPPLSAAHQRIVHDALLRQQVAPPAGLKELIGKSSELMGGSGRGDSLTLRGPIGTRVLSDRPILRWQRLPGAPPETKYEVSITDSDFNEVETSPSLSTTEWRPRRPLKRGAIYVWQVIARVGDQEVARAPKPDKPKAKFQVLNPAEAAEIARARKTYAGSHLVLGALYARAGLLDEAEQEFEALRNANPGSPVAQKLLGRVRALRRQA